MGVFIWGARAGRKPPQITCPWSNRRRQPPQSPPFRSPEGALKLPGAWTCHVTLSHLLLKITRLEYELFLRGRNTSLLWAEFSRGGVLLSARRLSLLRRRAAARVSSAPPARRSLFGEAGRVRTELPKGAGPPLCWSSLCSVVGFSPYAAPAALGLKPHGGKGEERSAGATSLTKSTFRIQRVKTPKCQNAPGAS